MNVTLPSTFLLQLITDVWSQVPGQIFLLSAMYYLFSAFLVAGYLAYFAGGFGNIGFGDYSIIDFLFFLPTLAITGLKIVFDNFKRVAINVSLYFIVPNYLGVWLPTQLYKIPNFSRYLPVFFFAPLFLYSVIIAWLIGFNILLSFSNKKLWVAVLLQFVSSLLFSTAAVGMVTLGITPPHLNLDPTLLTILAFGSDLFLLTVGVGTGLLIILLLGMQIARESINSEYLSQIIKVQTVQPIPSLEKWRAMEKSEKNTLWNIFQSKQTIPTNYQYVPEGAALLVASLKRVTAIYIDKSVELSNGRGKLLLISNTTIVSMELKSGKRSA